MPMPMTRAPIARRAIPRDVGSPGFAALLSGLLPGLGQVYGERWIKGILMLLLPILANQRRGIFVDLDQRAAGVREGAQLLVQRLREGEGDPLLPDLRGIRKPAQGVRPDDVLLDGLVGQ